MKKLYFITFFAAILSLSATLFASASKTGSSYSKEFPFLKGNINLVTGCKDTKSNSKVVNNFVGGSYTVDLWTLDYLPYSTRY